ncbi:hypothetical protein FBZ85_105415 [Azospirillum brasilense]|nr:hypothetical protein [Azospirillum baldaniorum]TWA79108.1 hypothetical protein FBZ85_105415 [Azospirillum brasilense]
MTIADTQGTGTAVPPPTGPVTPRSQEPERSFWSRWSALFWVAILFFVFLFGPLLFFTPMTSPVDGSPNRNRDLNFYDSHIYRANPILQWTVEFFVDRHEWTCDSVNDIQSRMEKESYSKENFNPKLIHVVQCHLNIWDYYMSRSQKLSYTLSVMSLIVTTLVASGSKLFPKSERFNGTLAWLSAVIAGLITLNQPSEAYTRFHDAWVLVNTRLNEYKLAETEHKKYEKELLRSYFIAETIINKGSTVSEELRKAAEALKDTAPTTPLTGKQDNQVQEAQK